MAPADPPPAPPQAAPPVPAPAPVPSRPKGWLGVCYGIVWRLLSFVLAAAIVYVCFTQWNRWEGEQRYQVTDDAYLQTNLTPLAAQISGYIATVPVQDYATVKAGQVIATIQDDTYTADVARAQAGLAQAEAALTETEAQRPLLQANLQAAQAIVAQTTASLGQNSRDVARQRRLMTSGSTSQSDLEQFQTTRAVAAAKLLQVQAQADAVQKQIDLLGAQEQQARANINAAQAALRLAQINLGYTRITAPTDGVIGLRDVLPGQYIGPGAQITTLTQLPLIWVIANYKETQLTHVVTGEDATITVDAFPGRKLAGKVIAVSPASGSEFALLPPDNATGNFTKIVQRIAVKIAVTDTHGLTTRLRAGMSAIPTIDTTLPDGSRP
ncbi:HlyD family secretion protein [Acidisoma cellulosilytica]|uniref:HlyD family secretion protein n=1 Tax=Acidisoma cellulosilyticum TaxID=2802395 RepID=A0A964E5A8_9PROT|nr:HlyD family secretion protein [Acidisoma cellulosilyticum]MCB8882346.1 HlyD family secretion protein [Acidisoma cellulosilyticum]